MHCVNFIRMLLKGYESSLAYRLDYWTGHITRITYKNIDLCATRQQHHIENSIIHMFIDNFCVFPLFPLYLHITTFTEMYKMHDQRPTLFMDFLCDEWNYRSVYFTCTLRISILFNGHISIHMYFDIWNSICTTSVWL